MLSTVAFSVALLVVLLVALLVALSVALPVMLRGGKRLRVSRERRIHESS